MSSSIGPYGKPALLIQGNVDYGISDQLSELFKGNAGNSLGAEIARRAASAATEVCGAVMAKRWLQ